MILLDMYMYIQMSVHIFLVRGGVVWGGGHLSCSRLPGLRRRRVWRNRVVSEGSAVEGIVVQEDVALVVALSRSRVWRFKSGSQSRLLHGKAQNYHDLN